MFGGFGSINHMIVTLRNNKNLLPKKRQYFRTNTYKTVKNEYYYAVGNAFDIKKATPDQIKQIRNKIIKNRRRKSLRLTIILSLALPLFCFGIYKMFHNFSFGFPKIEQKTSAASAEKSKQQKYLFYLSDGDMWIKKGKWYNAVFQYKKALQLYPNDFAANYRLAVGYSYRCQYDFEDCRIGMQLVKKLEEQFPKNKDIQDVKAVFLNWGE